jgi:hypothetical protein
MAREVGARFVLPFRFVMHGAERTSHYLVFLSKNFLGYKIMRDVMANASSYSVGGVASFEYNATPQLFLPDGHSTEVLAESLARELAGSAMRVEDVFEKHSAGRLYVMPNYRAALLDLEGSVAMSCPPRSYLPAGGGPMMLV